jgi:integrase
MALTDLEIKKLKPKDKLYRVADSGGLCIEIATSGSKLWRWRYLFNGKAQMAALGAYPALSLAEARKKRDAEREQLKFGNHPTLEKKAQRLRRVYEGILTFEKLGRDWFKQKEAEREPKSLERDLARMATFVFPKIGALAITEISPIQIVDIMREIAAQGKPETAKRVKQIISRIFRYAIQCDLCRFNPAGELRDILPKRIKRKHHASIPFAELPALLLEIHARPNDLTKYAMLLDSLTLLRTNELIGGKWAEINWDKEQWEVAAERMKMKEPHIVPLPRQAIKILTELQQITGNREYIFYNAASKSKHLSNGAILMGLRRMGYANKMTGHGFRSLASTILNEIGYPSDIIERQLAHKETNRIRDAYNRAEYLAERKKMMQDYADILDRALNDRKFIIQRITAQAS